MDGHGLDNDGWAWFNNVELFSLFMPLQYVVFFHLLAPRNPPAVTIRIGISASLLPSDDSAAREFVLFYMRDCFIFNVICISEDDPLRFLGQHMYSSPYLLHARLN